MSETKILDVCTGHDVANKPLLWTELFFLHGGACLLPNMFATIVEKQEWTACVKIKNSHATVQDEDYIS